MKGKSKEAVVHEKQLSLPDVASIDHTKTCPRYTSILNRQDGVGVGIEEMDSLQMEIESLLVNAMQRNRMLKVETTVLDTEKPETLTINANSLKAVLNGSDKPTTSSATLNKKFKSFSGKPAANTHAGLSMNTASTAAALFFKPSHHHNASLNDSSGAPIVRNEIPDIFWSSVEPYCASITDDDIRLLESQLELNDRYLEFPKLGPVGKHYSLQWADEDLSQQIKEGSRCLDLDSSSHASAAHHSHCQTPSPGGKRKSVDPNASLIRKNSLIQESVAKINKLASGGQQTETSMSYGPLTQRLISALIEQNLMTPFDHEITDYLDKIGPPQTASFLSPKTLAKSFHFSSNHTQHIERKLKRTLIEQGILELDEVEAKAEPVSQEDSQGANDAEGGVDGDDEIAVEIGNLQAELRLVTRQCKQTISQLLGIAKLDMQRQEVKKSLDGVDHEIADLFEKFKNSRLNKKPLTKREKDKAQRLIRERQALKAQLSHIK